MKNYYTDKRIKIWYCERCEQPITGKVYKTTERSATNTHRKSYCKNCWNKTQ
jgi:ribosomal protein L37AE/L43A